MSFAILSSASTVQRCMVDGARDTFNVRRNASCGILETPYSSSSIALPIENLL